MGFLLVLARSLSVTTGAHPGKLLCCRAGSTSGFVDPSPEDPRWAAAAGAGRRKSCELCCSQASTTYQRP